MKFAVAKEHRDFFLKQGWIEFADLLSPSQLAQINQSIDQVLAERLGVSIERLRTLSSEALYLQGHDLWRSNDNLKKIVTHPKFAEIASELIEKKPLRLGYDQFLPARTQGKFNEQVQHLYSRFIDQSASLESVSCLSNVIGGLVISLGGSKDADSEKTVEGVGIFPSQPGHVIFFQPQVIVNWQNLYSLTGQRFYLIVYTQNVSHYQLQPQDPHTHALKQLGYVFNDKLLDKLNPIVYR